MSPADVGAPRIGHFGWVRQPYEQGIWAPIRDWLLRRLEPTPISRTG